MQDPELNRDTAEILLNRACLVLQQLMEMWDNPSESRQNLPPGYFDDSCSDDFDWYMGYKDADMLIELTMDMEESPKVHVSVNGYADFTAGETYAYNDLQMSLVVHEAFWELYRKIKGL